MASKTLRIRKSPDPHIGQLHTKTTVTFETGTTVLVGCNGSGKTSLMYQMHDILRKQDGTYVEYVFVPDAVNLGNINPSDLERLVTLMNASEGERLTHGIGPTLARAGAIVRGEDIRSNLERALDERAGREPKHYHEVWLLIDGIDSGLDVAELELLRDVLDTALADMANQNDIDVYAVISSNTYQLARDADCLDVRSCNHLRFDNYEDYLQFIRTSREAKFARYDELAQRKDTDHA